MTDVGSRSGRPAGAGDPDAAPLPAGGPRLGHTTLGPRLAALLALPPLASALLSAAFVASVGDPVDGGWAAAALVREARGREIHLAALQHRDAVRDLLARRGGRRDVDAAALRMEQAAGAYLGAPGALTTGVDEAVGRAEALAREAESAAGPLASIRARFDDGYARQVLPALEDAVRGEGDRARAALAAAQRAGRRRLAMGAGAALLAVLLALVPPLLLARRLSGWARRDRERLVAAAEARIRAQEEGRAELETRADESTRALARAHAEISESLRRLSDAQQRLTASDRLAVIGHLAAAVAHEVNSPISSVSSNLGFLAEEVRTLAGELRAGGAPLDAGREAEMASAFADARDASQRVARIVRDLGTIARGEGEPLARVDPRLSVEAALNVSLAAMKHCARVERQLGEVPEVLASASRLGQVFLPILLLAGRSIGARGRGAWGTIHVATWTDPEGPAVVEIADDGAGMTAEAVARLFDPFVPLQPVGPALTPGLAMAHGIVTSLGGSIEVRSAVGAGTAVRVTLPPARPARGADTLLPPGHRAAASA